MKFEIKRINIYSFLFGAFPMVIFFTSLILGVVGIFFLDNPAWIAISGFGKLVGLLIHSLVYFVITAAYLVFLAFVYNFFVETVGMKGISVKIEEIQ